MMSNLPTASSGTLISPLISPLISCLGAVISLRAARSWGPRSASVGLWRSESARVARTASVAGLCLLTALSVGAAGCNTRGSQDRIVITGSSTLAPLIREIGRRFEQTHEGLRVDVQSGGSSRGLADARQGLADVGMVSRAQKSGEDDLRWFPVARDGVAVIVHASNPIEGLSSEQVRAIYLRRVRDWSEVGGAPGPITLVHKAEGRSTLEVFLAYFELENRDIEPDVVVGDNLQGIKTVSGDPAAIGYVSVGTAEFEVERGTSIRIPTLDGIPGTVAAVARGEFPVARTLNLVTAEAPAGLVRDFIDFARSPGVRDLLEAQFFVPVDG